MIVMAERLLIVAAALLGLALLVCSIFTIRYRVTPRHLKITWLWFIPVRLIGLRNVKYVSAKQVFWAENWWNTFNIRNRTLVITKRTGLFKEVVITPRNPFVFKAQIERARQELLGPSASGRYTPL